MADVGRLLTLVNTADACGRPQIAISVHQEAVLDDGRRIALMGQRLERVGPEQYLD